MISPFKDGVVVDWDIVDNIWDHAFRCGLSMLLNVLLLAFVSCYLFIDAVFLCTSFFEPPIVPSFCGMLNTTKLNSTSCVTCDHRATYIVFVTC